MADYDIGKAFERIENELIASMMRNLKNHRAQETAEGIQWAQWQVEQLAALEKYKIENSKKYGTNFRSINQRIKKQITEMKKLGGFEQERRILNAVKRGFKGYKLADNTVQGEFFKINEHKLDALIKATVSDMKKAETAILRMANDKYRKAIYNSVVYASTGGTYEKAVDMAVKDMLSTGLNCVEYKNGARHTLPDYADMAVKTACKRAYLQGEGEKRAEWGISTVILNKRTSPCPLCMPFVGKVFIDDVWSGGKASDGPYPLLSSAIAQGLYHPRCKDSHTTYFEGISTPPSEPTAVEKQEKADEYAREQKERQAEKQAEKCKRISNYSLDKGDKQIYKVRAKQWQDKADVLKKKIDPKYK